MKRKAIAPRMMNQQRLNTLRTILNLEKISKRIKSDKKNISRKKLHHVDKTETKKYHRKYFFLLFTTKLNKKRKKKKKNSIKTKHKTKV